MSHEDSSVLQGRPVLHRRTAERAPSPSVRYKCTLAAYDGVRCFRDSWVWSMWRTFRSSIGVGAWLSGTRRALLGVGDDGVPGVEPWCWFGRWITLASDRSVDVHTVVLWMWFSCAGMPFQGKHSTRALSSGCRQGLRCCHALHARGRPCGVCWWPWKAETRWLRQGRVGCMCGFGEEHNTYASPKSITHTHGITHAATTLVTWMAVWHLVHVCLPELVPCSLTALLCLAQL